MNQFVFDTFSSYSVPDASEDCRIKKFFVRLKPHVLSFWTSDAEVFSRTTFAKFSRSPTNAKIWRLGFLAGRLPKLHNSLWLENCFFKLQIYWRQIEKCIMSLKPSFNDIWIWRHKIDRIQDAFTKTSISIEWRRHFQRCIILVGQIFLFETFYIQMAYSPFGCFLIIPFGIYILIWT